MLTFMREDLQRAGQRAWVAGLVLSLVVPSTALTSELSNNKTRREAGTPRDSAARLSPGGTAARERLQQRVAELSQLREQLLSDLASVQRAAPDVPVDLRPTILNAIERGLHDAKIERERRLESLANAYRSWTNCCSNSGRAANPMWTTKGRCHPDKRR